MEERSFDGPRIERAVREILAALGEDAEREGLRETPARGAAAYARLFSRPRPDPLRPPAPPLAGALGGDAEREGPREPPARVAAAYARLFSGLHQDPLRHLDVSFEESARDLVLMRGIPFVSVCEHHPLPMIDRPSV